jgi:hypothetical protein
MPQDIERVAFARAGPWVLLKLRDEAAWALDGQHFS